MASSRALIARHLNKTCLCYFAKKRHAQERVLSSDDLSRCGVNKRRADRELDRSRPAHGTTAVADVTFSALERLKRTSLEDEVK